VLLSAVVLGVDAAAPFATPAAAQSATQTPAQRCSQLIAYYDRFGVGRSLHTDGRRNTTRADAEIDCSRGLYAQGIATMEKLLAAKKFTPPPSGLPDEPDVDE
jgi:hypothetical protein